MTHGTKICALRWSIPQHLCGASTCKLDVLFTRYIVNKLNECVLGTSEF